MVKYYTRKKTIHGAPTKQYANKKKNEEEKNNVQKQTQENSPVCYSCISFVKLHQSQSAPFDILGTNHFDQHFLKLWSKKFRYFYSKTYQLTKHCRRLEFGSGAKVPALPCHQRCFSMQTEAVVLGRALRQQDTVVMQSIYLYKDTVVL
uniref:Uncharacterized protein n=1 Tax=Romanomermis culicivorax TaxID=13658 RepID=A0A915J6W0_ROMCU